MKKANRQGDGRRFMLEALALAKKGEGKVSPNPLVGAVIVKSGRVIGKGWHEYYGGKHAEANAIENAIANAAKGRNKKAKSSGQNRADPKGNGHGLAKGPADATNGADLYVTLEPCNHYGKQPPCTKAIINAGIRKVFYAMHDPNKISRKGGAELRKKGVEAHEGLCRKEAEKLNEFYAKSARTGMPFIAIKSAVTSGGFISWGNGKKKQVSSREGTAFVQSLRKKFDAVLIGANTAAKDNPRLTYRKDQRFNPIRVILDSKAGTRPDSKAFSQKGETLVLCTKKAKPEKIRGLVEKGATVIVAKQRKGMVDLKWAMKTLCKAGIHSILAEAGQATGSSFIESGLFDRVYILVSPKKVESGLMAFSLKKPVKLRAAGMKNLGPDLLIELENA